MEEEDETTVTLSFSRTHVIPPYTTRRFEPQRGLSSSLICFTHLLCPTLSRADGGLAPELTEGEIRTPTLPVALDLWPPHTDSMQTDRYLLHLNFLRLSPAFGTDRFLGKSPTYQTASGWGGKETHDGRGATEPSHTAAVRSGAREESVAFN
ncbi:unnamed protein product [Pleuronectes platessa]|uniref:Uncharacterized protein n=1 Tax=Pleuronectes platessa TaxID=8262 RepID=A0A9N7V127_PLEPL|nr:unnamed protein product [Pleuronectes platessa]